VVLLGPFLSVAVALCFSAFTAIMVRISTTSHTLVRPSITFLVHFLAQVHRAVASITEV
jgi:hypothetical protein